MTGRPVIFLSSWPRLASCDCGKCTALGTRPPWYSFGSRTSSISALRRLMSCVASIAPISRTVDQRYPIIGHSNIPPETIMARISHQLFSRNCRSTTGLSAVKRNSRNDSVVPIAAWLREPRCNHRCRWQAGGKAWRLSPVAPGGCRLHRTRRRRSGRHRRTAASGGRHLAHHLGSRLNGVMNDRRCAPIEPRNRGRLSGLQSCEPENARIIGWREESCGSHPRIAVPEKRFAMRNGWKKAGLIGLGAVLGLLLSLNFSAMAEKEARLPIPYDDLQLFSAVFGRIKSDYVEAVPDDKL